MVLLIGSQLDEDQWISFANSLWAIWRCRNDATYNGKKADFHQFKSYLNSISWESLMRASTPVNGVAHRLNQIQEAIPKHEYVCYFDGAWIDRWNSGTGLVIFQNGELILFKSSKAEGCSSLSLEALALRDALVQIQTLGISHCSFLSNCEVLVKAVNNESPPPLWSRLEGLFCCFASLGNF